MTEFATPTWIAKQLIQIPSQNPMGHPHSGPDWSEQRVSQWLCEFLAGHNVTHRYFEIESGRGNVVAWLPGTPDGPTVLLDAHQDTVPTSGMTIEPFTPIERDGRLFGRGACDVKGAMASMLAAAIRLAGEGKQTRANVILSMTCDEEFGQLGAIDLAKRLGNDSAVMPRVPDLAIVSEPTDLNVVIAHKGVLRWRIKTSGTSVHSSRPDAGVNAVYAMAKIVSALESIADQLSIHGPRHPLCGQPTLIVGTIRGGQSVNIVPDECHIEIDRRVLPGESIEVISQQTEQAIRELADVPFEMLPPDTLCDPLMDGDNHKLAETLRNHATDVAGHSQAVGVAYTTHAPKFAAIGIPTVVFGPGSIDQAHTKDEWIETRQLDQSAEILYRLISQL